MGALNPVPQQAPACAGMVGMEDNAGTTLLQSHTSGTAGQTRDFNPASRGLLMLCAAPRRPQVFYDSA